MASSGDFDRDAVSVILRRAIDLAADIEGRRDDGLTAADLAAVADEVGIPRSALAAALAESRAGFGPRRGIIDRLVGPAQVAAIIPLPDDEAAAAANLRRWLEVEHGLNAVVRGDGVVVATRRAGLPGAIGAGVRRLQGRGGLDRARSIRAATASIDDDGTVCVVADVSNKRAEAMVGGSAVTGGSVVVIGLVATVTTPLALVAVPVAVVAGLGTARLAHRRTVDQVARQVAVTSEAAVGDDHPTHPVERLLRSGIPRLGRAGRRTR